MTHFLAAFLMLLTLAAPAVAQTRALPPGEIRANGDITFGNALKLGKREGNKTVITPDTLQILGTGSTGDVRGMSTPGAGTLLRGLQDRFAERPSVIDYGVDMSGVNDSTAAFTAALNSERPVTAPCGTVRLLSTVTVTARTHFTGAGPCTFLKYDATGGTPARPLMDIKASAAGSQLSDFSFDHQAQGNRFTDPTVYGGNLIAGSAILVQADDTSLRNVSGANGYDNCIAVVRLPDSGPSWQAIAGRPFNYSLQTIRTQSCGQNQYKAGAGVDIASGSGGTVDDLVDRFSFGAFILDIGAGAQGSFSNMTGIATSFDPARFAFDGTRSQTFYIGSGDSTFTNITSIDASDRALWLDGFADRTTINGANLKTAANEAAIFKVRRANINGLTINSPGYGKTPGTVDALILDTSAFSADGLSINGLKIEAQFNTARFGIRQVGANPATGYAVGDFSGAVTATSGVSATFGVVSGAALGGAWTAYTPTVTCQTAGQSLASVTASGQFRRVGNTVSVNIDSINITDRGTCTGAINVTLPLPVSIRTTFSGQETAVSGVALVGTVYEGTSNIQVKRSDGATSAVSGYVLTGRTEYQTP